VTKGIAPGKLRAEHLSMAPFSFVSRFLLYRGKHVITCPETLRPAAVDVDALHAALAGDLRLSACSRWPERAGCDQACLREIAARPEDCRLHSMVAAWYEGKACAYCARAIGPIVWHDRPPALLAPDGTTREWKDVLPEDLPELFSTHKPLCWSCHNIAAFQREFPGLAFERPGASPIIARND
jgi:hypothetical protein